MFGWHQSRIIMVVQTSVQHRWEPEQRNSGRKEEAKDQTQCPNSYFCDPLRQVENNELLIQIPPKLIKLTPLNLITTNINSLRICTQKLAFSSPHCNILLTQTLTFFALLSICLYATNKFFCTCFVPLNFYHTSDFSVVYDFCVPPSLYRSMSFTRKILLGLVAIIQLTSMFLEKLLSQSTAGLQTLIYQQIY